MNSLPIHSEVSCRRRELLSALFIVLVFLERKQSGEVAGASNSECLFTRQCYSMMGYPACQDDLELGKFGKESKNRAGCQGIIYRDTKGEKVKEDAFGFRSRLMSQKCMLNYSTSFIDPLISICRFWFILGWHFLCLRH